MNTVRQMFPRTGLSFCKNRKTNSVTDSVAAPRHISVQLQSVLNVRTKATLLSCAQQFFPFVTSGSCDKHNQRANAIQTHLLGLRTEGKLHKFQQKNYERCLKNTKRNSPKKRKYCALNKGTPPRVTLSVTVHT